MVCSNNPLTLPRLCHLICYLHFLWAQVCSKVSCPNLLDYHYYYFLSFIVYVNQYQNRTLRMVVPWYDNESYIWWGLNLIMYISNATNFHHEVTSCVSTQAFRSLFLSHQKWPFISPLTLLCVQRVFTFNTRMWPVELTRRFSNQKLLHSKKILHASTVCITFSHGGYIHPMHGIFSPFNRAWEDLLYTTFYKLLNLSL